MTCHKYVTRYVQRSSRVSHATHTTPHHTMSVLTASCGVSNSKSIHRYGSRGTDRLAWMTADAVIGGGW